MPIGEKDATVRQKQYNIQKEHACMSYEQKMIRSHFRNRKKILNFNIWISNLEWVYNRRNKERSRLTHSAWYDHSFNHSWQSQIIQAQNTALRFL